MQPVHSPETEAHASATKQSDIGDAPSASAANAVASQPQSSSPTPLERIQNVLRPALSAKHRIEWESLKQHAEFPEREPDEPKYAHYPPEPNAEDPRYKPATHAANGALDPNIEQRRREGYERFVRDYSAWADLVKKIEAENESRYAASVAAVRDWNRRSRQYHQSQAEHNDAVDRRQADYMELLASAVEDYCRQILSASPLPEPLSRVFELKYFPESKTLLVEHSLPTPESLPRTNGVKFVKCRGAFAEVRVSDTQLSRIYSDLAYQICLRTLHELFAADIAQGLDCVVFNGWVEVPASETGERRRCVLSLKAGKKALAELNLSELDAKSCFKALKGVARAKLHMLESVKPLLERSEHAQ